MNDQATLMNQQNKQPFMNMNQLHQPQQQMLPINRNSYGMWAPQQQFQNPNNKTSSFGKSLGPRNNWKGKKANQLNDKRRKDLQKSVMLGPNNNMVTGVVNPSYNVSYQPPVLNELQQQNRLKTRKFFPKKKFNNKNNNNNVMNMNMNLNMNANNMNVNMSDGNMKYYKNSRSAPFAPRNTSSFLIRAKKSGGITSLVSPCPVTPAVLPTPVFSPSREVLVDMAKEEWGVDGYGSMKGLIRLRSPGHELEPNEDDEVEEGGSSESDVEEHLEVEKRLDHDLSRFEMIYDPNNVGASGMEYHNVLENRVDDQDSHISQLEEENLILKERLFLMERELGDLRRRMLCLEKGTGGQEFNEEVVENDSENDSESREDAHSMDDNTGDFSEDNIHGEGYGSSKVKGNDGDNGEGSEVAVATGKHLNVVNEGNNDNLLVVADKNCNITSVSGKDDNNTDQITEANKSLDVHETNKEWVKANKTIENVAVEEGPIEKLKSDDNADTESSDTVMLGDVRMEEVGPADDNVAPEK